MVGQEKAIFEPSDLLDQVKVERNIGFSLGFNPFPQELLFNLEFRASKRLSPFISLNLGYDEIRSEPVENGTNLAGITIYELPTIVGEEQYYNITIGSRLTLGNRTVNYAGLILDLGLMAKLAGDDTKEYYSAICRFGYRLFLTPRLYILAGSQFNLAYSVDSWNPSRKQTLLPDFDVDLLNVRVGYQF